MQPYVSLIVQLLAEGEQQSSVLFDTFSVGNLFVKLHRVALIAFALPYAILSVAFGDKKPNLY